MNHAAVDLIAQQLVLGLPHPGNDGNGQKPFTIPLPLRSNGIPPEMAAQFANAAGLPPNDAPKLIAEAIVNLLETNGAMTIIGNAELQELRATAAKPPEGVRTIKVHCRCDSQRRDPLLELTIGNRDYVTLDGRAVLTALASRPADCPHQDA